MPFAKWNLEPVYVARTTPWTLPTKVVRPSTAAAAAAAAATTSSPINDDHKTAPKLPNISGKLNRIGSKQQRPPPQQYHDNGDTIIINGVGIIDDGGGGDGETTQTSGAKINGDHHHQPKKQLQQQPPAPPAAPHPSQSPLINGSIGNEDGGGGGGGGGDARNKLDHLKNNGQHQQKEEEDEDEDEIMFIDGQDNHHQHHHHHHHVNDDNGQNIEDVGDDDDGKLSKKFNQNIVKKNTDAANYCLVDCTTGNHHDHHHHRGGGGVVVVHHPKDLTDDEQILLKIRNRTLVGIIKQMVSLLSSSDQMFQEITDECRRLMDRSGKLRQRFQKLTTGVDRLNHLMRHTAPRIGNIFDYKQLSKEVKHYKSELKLDRSLFTIDTRPLSVRNLYARAHAPGDVRLSCTIFSPFGRQQSNQNQNRGQNMQLIMNQNGLEQQSQQSCQCQCGHCHPMSNVPDLAGDQPKPSPNIIPNDNLFKNVMTESEYETSRRSCECCNNDEHTNGISPESNESSSSSSIVTWSSVTSSTFESMGHPHPHHHHHHHHQHNQPSQQSTTTTNTTISQQQSSQQQKQKPPQQSQPNQQSSMQNKSLMIKSSKAKIKPMSSFSSSGDYYPNGTKTIDDFFRKNNIVDDPINKQQQQQQKHQQNQRDSQCRCSCFERQMATPDTRIGDCLKSVEFKNPLTTGEKGLHQNDHHHQHHRYPQNPQSNIVAPLSLSRQASSNGAIYNPDDYWYWWWWWAEDENRRRWSSALTGSSPLKPTILDEMTIWLRENIETRRPESLVIKSASELPKNVLLERALSPPCSTHNITLRKRTEPTGNDFNDGKDGTYPKLKRRWSLLPFRRLSKRWSKRFDHTKRTSLMLMESNETENLETIKDHENNEHSSHENLIDLDDDQETDDNGPKEIVLMSPEERSKLLADQFAQFSMVDIDVSGRSFDRLSKTRRSLIHADFQIPRNKIPGQRRSRSKSPHPRSSKLNHGDEQLNQSENTVSPYALSQLMVQDKQSKMNRTIEKGCQTDTNLLLGGLLNKDSVSGATIVGNNPKAGGKFTVPIDVHNNDEDFQNNPRNNFNRKTKSTTTGEFDARRFMRRDYRDNDNGADGDEDIDDEDNDDDEDDGDDDEYVVILKKHPNTHGHYYKPNPIRLDDTTSSNASVDMEWMKRLQDGGKPCLASSPMIQMKNCHQQQPPPPPPSAAVTSSPTSKLTPATTAGTAATISKATPMEQNQESKSNNDGVNVDNLNLNQKSKQNGARSSSGNWSAATSDLVHSSSSSSSPPLHVLKRHLTNQSKAATATANVDPGTTASVAAIAASSAVSGIVGKRLLNPKSLNIKDQAQQQPAAAALSLSAGSGNTSANNNNTNNNNNNNGGANEEAESVYSVDNDGYYTSMHTDSGLFFGSNSLPMVHPHQPHHHQHQHPHHPNQGINSGRNRSNISTFTSQTSLSKRQQQMIDASRNKIKLNKIKKSEENFRISLLSRWKRFNNNAATTVPAKNNPEFLQNIDDDDDDDFDNEHGAANVKQSLLENDLMKSKDQPQYGSNVSINSILSNSDAATSTANMDHASFGTNSSMVDFDCSVSHCSHQIASTSSGHHHHHPHQNPNKDKDNMMIMMRKMKPNNRMRSVSGGGYDEVNHQNNNTLIRSSTTSNSSETLHTNDYDDELLPETDSAVATTSNIQQRRGRSNVGKIQNVNVAKSGGSGGGGGLTKSATSCPKRYASLTESSSNSSSCRKLPPPPPPPRVSSMLRTLQKYNSNPGSRQQRAAQQRGSSVSSYAGSDITSGIPTITSQTTTSDSQNNGQNNNQDVNAINNGGDLSLTSETNSEYLHEKHDERRRRLFLEVDSNRSYPPLSYIYDQTDTATSVSIPSSACFEIEELELDHQHPHPHHHQPRTNENGDTADGKRISMLGQNMDSVSAETTDKTVVVDGGASGGGGKKQLEERHLSSPLPPPKLDSFTFNNNNKNPNSKSSGHHHHHYHYYHPNHGSSPKLRSKSSSSSSSASTAATTTTTITITTSSNSAQQGGDAYSSKLSSTSSLSSSTIKAPSSPESIPKPKPRNSLIFSSSTFTTSHETESTDPKAEDSKRITETQSKQPHTQSPPQQQQQQHQQSRFRDSSKTTTSSSTSTKPISSSGNSSTGSGPGRRLTTEDLFIILHNSKKRHNIRADPQIFPPAHHRLATSPNGSSSNGSGTRSPMTSPDQGWKSASPVTNNNTNTGSKTTSTFSTTGYPVPETLKRRSWTTAADSLQKTTHNAQVPRTRQSLALDRLGPVRPTTLNDFKRLLSQVRSTTTSTSGGGQQVAGAGAAAAAAGGSGGGGSTSPTSIYVALQQVLKSSSISHNNENNENRSPNSPRTSSLSSNTENASGSSHAGVSSPPSSGVSSLSPMCSPLSPYKSINSSNNNNKGSKSPMIGSPTNPIKRHQCHNPIQSLSTASGHHHQHQSQPINQNQSMNNFMKKFSKSKLLSNMYSSNVERSGTSIGSVGSLASGMSRSSTVSARLDVCPTIPEDDSVCTITAADTLNTPAVVISTNTNKTDNAKSSADPQDGCPDKSNKKDDNDNAPSCSESSKHNCTSTWV